MLQRLTPATAALLTIPPLLWAGNAIVGRLVAGYVPPLTLNFLRWVLAFALLYVAVFPSIVAYRSWALGVQRVGPNIAGFFNNLTPLFAALMSAAFLGEAPQPYHVLAFALIVGGIVLSSRRG